MVAGVVQHEVHLIATVQVLEDREEAVAQHAMILAHLVVVVGVILAVLQHLRTLAPYQRHRWREAAEFRADDRPCEASILRLLRAHLFVDEQLRGKRWFVALCVVVTQRMM